MGQQLCTRPPFGAQSMSDHEFDFEDAEYTAHAKEVHRKVAILREKFGWHTDPEVENALAETDMNQYRGILKRPHGVEPNWDQDVHGAFMGDKRVQNLAAGGFVFENVSVYAVLVQLLYPSIVEGVQPRVLDIGCGTGFLTTVLARLVRPRGGSVVAIDMFARQVEHAQRTMTSCCPELLPYVTFQVADGWQFREPTGKSFHTIAVACQASEVPQALVQQLAPGGHLVCPVGNSEDRRHKKGPYHKYWLVRKGSDGSILFSGRAGPIGVNFVPFLPPPQTKRHEARVACISGRAEASAKVRQDGRMYIGTPQGLVKIPIEPGIAAAGGVAFAATPCLYGVGHPVLGHRC
mmetsp:Transcript_101806/g.218009  ORF Transcript_101806/g.218009 Transcript_101806/m.218009 type:complete len:349 (+) Transcript_101806:103-1149(+)